MKVGKKFTKDFHLKKKIIWKFLVKWTKIKIQWDSFVKFSVGGSRSIYRGVTYKIEEEKIYKGFPCKSFLLEVPDQFLGEFRYKFEEEKFTKVFLVKKKKYIRELFVIWSQIKSKANSHIKSCKKKIKRKLHIKCPRIIFKRISSMFFSKRSEFCFSMKIVCKMNPDKI